MNFINQGTPLPVFSREQVRDIETMAIQEHDIKSYDLMQQAGKAALKLIQALYPNAKNILIIAGGGNNAGDGYVLARLLKNSDIHCVVMPVVPLTKLRGDAMRAQNEFAIHDGLDIEVSAQLPACDLIVDALFGIGLTRPIEGEFAEVVNAINQTPAPVLALDIPSGLNADTGNSSGPTVYANTTISFVGVKSGLLTGEARNFTGDVAIDTLGIPDSLIDSADKLGYTLANPTPNQLLAPRKESSYKNNHGHVLVVGGNIGYPNAARLAGEAAARTGAGLVTIATHPDSVAPIAAGCASLMVNGIQDPRQLNNLLRKADAVVIGPGLGQDKWAQKIFAHVIETELPLVVDADALHLLSKNPSKSDHWVLTPHPGEAAQLLSCNKDEIQLHRLTSVLAIEEQYGGMTILKGSGSLTCYEQEIGFCTSGNASLATGGTGDVLAGIIAGLMAQGASLRDATHCGIMLHGRAAEMVSTDGSRGILAQDLFPALYKLVNT